VHPNRRFISIAGVGCALAAALAGCASGGSSSSSPSSSSSSTPVSNASDSSSSPAAAAGDYVIGVDDVLSGPLASYGQSFLTNARSAVNYVNANGGVSGHQVKLVSGDSAATGQNASSVAQQLISTENVSAIVGFTLSDDCAAVSALATARQVPIVCTSIAPSQLSPVEKYTFSGDDVELEEIPGTIAFVKDYLKLAKGSTFAILDASPIGVQLWAKQLTADLESDGYKSVANETIPITSVNGSTQISQVVSAKPDIVFAEPVASMYLPLVQALRAAGNNGPVVSAHNGVGYQGIASIQDPNLYDITPTEYVTNTASPQAGAAMYIDGMKSLGQTSLSQLNGIIGAPGFLTVYGITQAFKACGYPCGGAGLATAMESLKLTMPGLASGTYGWTSSVHTPYAQEFVYAWDPTTKAPKIVEQNLVLGSPTQ
jgi:ABC-type branched-subunit amino acid transport system substrate-binding protein